MKLVRHIVDNKGSEIWSVGSKASVLDAITLMAEKKIGALLVMDGDDLNGILSERDYARKVILKGKSSEKTPVTDIMTPDVIVTSPEETVKQCMKLMTEHHCRHLPVVEGGKVVAVVSIGDLVKAIIEEQQFKIEQLESFITTGY